MIACHGIRGATTADANTDEAVTAATQELLEYLIAKNNLNAAEIGAVFFTTTPDINAAFPAKAAWRVGWGDVPLLGAQEIGVPGAPALCIRILILWNTSVSPADIKHIYLRGAKALRPDRAR